MSVYIGIGVGSCATLFGKDCISALWRKQWCVQDSHLALRIGNEEGETQRSIGKELLHNQ